MTTEGLSGFHGSFIRDGFTGGGRCAPLALARGGARGAIFHDKKKTIRDKMRFSNLSNNMMIR